MSGMLEKGTGAVCKFSLSPQTVGMGRSSFLLAKLQAAVLYNGANGTLGVGRLLSIPSFTADMS